MNEGQFVAISGQLARLIELLEAAAPPVQATPSLPVSVPKVKPKRKSAVKQKRVARTQ